MREILNQVAAIFADRVETAVDSLSAETPLRDWDGMDSLLLAEFFAEVEHALCVELPDRHCVEFRTLGDVADYIERVIDS